MGDYVLDFSFLTVITTCAEVEPRSTSLKLIRRMNVDIIRKKKKKVWEFKNSSPSQTLRGKTFLRPCFLNYAVFQQLLIKQDDKTMCVAACWVGSE